MGSSDLGQAAEAATTSDVVVSAVGPFGNAPRRQAEETSDLESFLWRLTRFGTKLSVQFESSGRIADIEAAISCQRLVIEYTSDAHPAKGPFLGNLGNSYHRRFNHSKELTDFDKGVEYLRQAISFTPDDHPDNPAMLNSLGGAYIRRFALLGERSDSDTGLDYLIHANSVAPDSHKAKPVILKNIACLYRTRFEQLSSLEDVSQSVNYLNQAVFLISEDHELLPGLLMDLATSHRIQFERLNNAGTLDIALDYSNRAIKLTPIGHMTRPEALVNLASLHIARFRYLGELSDINNTIDCLIQALSLTPDQHQSKLGRLIKLGDSYQARFDHAGDVSDLGSAIDCHNQAALLACDGHESKKSVINSLGNLYAGRFKHLGELEDIDKAISYHRQAVTLTPDSHELRTSVLTNCGNSHYQRFCRLGDISDVNKTINYLYQAMSLTPDADPDKPQQLNSLGLAYLARYKALGDLPDMNDGIVCLSQAVSLTPDDHVDKPRVLGNLGISYANRFRSQGDCADINQAIGCLREAVRLTSDSHSYKSGRLTTLGEVYQLRFERFSDPQDNNEAISCHIRALSLIPDGHADKPMTLMLFAESCTASRDDSYLPMILKLIFAVISFREAGQCQTGDPHIRFLAARAWAEMDFLDNDSRQLAYQRTMELLPQLVWLGTTIDQRYKLISELGSIATEAASFAISCGNYNQALEWLEEARSIVWNQILQLRTPLQELSSADQELAKRLEGIGRELERAGSRSTQTSLTADGPLDLGQTAERHRGLAAEWNRLLNQARAIPGFQDFMRPRTVREFLGVAKDGPVVVINVHSSRCDALILLPNSNEIAHVPLESFSSDKAVNARVELVSLLGTRLRGGRAGGFKRSNPTSNPEDMFKRMLATLWLDVVSPVLDFLGYTQKPRVDELPHITWCTTGPLSFLPLHAAGCYDGIQPNVFDLVVSSYTPTLSSLLAPAAQSPSTDTGILAVGQEQTKTLDDLPNVVPELRAIKEHAKSTRYLQLDGNNATVDSVLDAMGQHNWVHLACHATQNREDPSQSAFHLSDGNLALATITKQSFTNKGLAFLSACQTAAGDDKLPDEAVHLAAGMLMAGYPSVIATMWSIDDADAPEVAERVYAKLLKDGSMNHRGAGRALHGAVAALREKVGEQSFLRWVPYIHIGT